MALLGLPRGPLGTLTEGKGKQDAPLGGYKGKKLHIAATVCKFKGGRIGHSQRRLEKATPLKYAKPESK